MKDAARRLGRRPAASGMEQGVTDPSRRTLDAAYGMLRNEGRPLPMRALLARALSMAGQADDGLAEAYTALNLDVRFVPLGRGEWGLREWGKGKRAVAEDSGDAEWE